MESGAGQEWDKFSDHDKMAEMNMQAKGRCIQAI